MYSLRYQPSINYNVKATLAPERLLVPRFSVTLISIPGYVLAEQKKTSLS